MRTMLLAMAATAMAAMAPLSANAFNTVNTTDFPICVESVTDGLPYSEVVPPHATSHGWYLDQTIELKITVHNLVVVSGDGLVTKYCNENLWTACVVGPHVQQVVDKIYFNNQLDLTPEQQQDAFDYEEPAEFGLECG